MLNYKYKVFLILLVLLTQLSGFKNANAQDVVVSTDGSSMPLEEFMDMIEGQTGIYFIFNQKNIDVNRIVNPGQGNIPLSEVLRRLFDGTGVNYQIIDGKILLTTESTSEEKIASGIASVTEKNIVYGQITDESGYPVPGVAVFIKGTTRGTISDYHGRYNLIVCDDAEVLVFSFLGMITREVIISDDPLTDVVLYESSIGLKGAVVTALGIRREKRALGYSVGIVEGVEINNANETNVISSLAGRVPGVDVALTSGQVGASARITIRGNSSFGDNEPLFVIDGIPYDNSEMEGIRQKVYEGPGGTTGIDLDPNIIESISILKGVAAAALYGSRAAAGVVLINTRSGDRDAPQVSYNYKFGLDDFYKIPIQKSWAQGEFEGVSGQPMTPIFYDGINEKTPNSWGPKIEDIPGAINYGKDRWDVFNSGRRSHHNLSIGGGFNESDYFISFSRLDQQGLLDPIHLDRTNILAKYQVDVNHWLNASISMNYSRTGSQTLYEGMNAAYSFMNSFLMTPNSYNPFPVYDKQGNMRWYASGAANNYLWILDNTRTTNMRDRFMPVVGVNVKFFDKLNLTTRFGVDYYNNFQDKFANNNSGKSGQTGIYEMQTNRFFNFNSDLMLAYSNDPGNRWSVDAMIGHNVQYSKSNMDMIMGKDFIIPDFAHINNCQTQMSALSTTELSSVSVYGQMVLGFNKLLYYTFTGRNDWASTLSAQNRSFFYPSNSLSFVFSELLDRRWLNYGKFRLSYATAGISPAPYQSYTKYTLASGGTLVFPFGGISSYMLGESAGNPGLAPEMTNEAAIGLDMAFFNNRLGFEASLYSKQSRNQLIYGQVSTATGIAGTMMNIGELQNKGVELLLFGTPVKTRDFSWDLTVTYSANRNMVVKVSDQTSRVQQAWDLVLEEGYPFPSINAMHFLEDDKGNKLVWGDPANPLYGYYMRSNHVFRGYNKPAGKIEPDWYGSINSQLRYKGISLSALVSMKYGGKVINMNEQYLLPIGMSIKTLQRTPDNTVVWPGVLANLDSNGNLVISDEENTTVVNYVESYTGTRGYRLGHDVKMQPSDFIRLKELTLRYEIPVSLIDRTGLINGLSMFLTGNNIWRKLHSDFTGSDPEFNLTGTSNAQGMSIWMMPAAKSYTMGIEINL